MQCECCVSSDAALLQRIGDYAPRIVVLDLHASTLDAVREIVRTAPATRVILLNVADDEHAIDGAIEAGAWGILSEGSDARTLLDAIQRVVAGEMVIPNPPDS